MAFHQHPRRHPLMRHRCGVKQRHARDEILRLAYVGDNRLLGLDHTGGRASQHRRRPHQPQKPPTRLRIVPIRLAVRKLVLDELAKLLGFGQFLQAAPILLLSRWHVTQSIRLFTGYSATSFGPISSWLGAGVSYAGLKTSERGRMYFDGSRWQFTH